MKFKKILSIVACAGLLSAAPAYASETSEASKFFTFYLQGDSKIADISDDWMFQGMASGVVPAWMIPFSDSKSQEAAKRTQTILDVILDDDSTGFRLHTARVTPAAPPTLPEIRWGFTDNFQEMDVYDDYFAPELGYAAIDVKTIDLQKMRDMLERKRQNGEITAPQIINITPPAHPQLSGSQYFGIKTQNK